MLKLVLDANTLVSAFFWKGNEYELFKLIEEGKAELYISREMLEEVEDVLNRDKFKDIIIKTNQTSNQIVQKIISFSHLVIGSKLNINVCRDADDNMILECAVHAKADFIVSGDKDLLSLKEYKNIKIISTNEILKILK